MAAPINSTPFEGRFLGLWRREQEVGVDRMFAREAKNVDLFGNVVAKRGGTHRLQTNPFGTTTNRRVHGLHNARFRNGSTQVIVAAGPKLQKAYNGATIVDPPTDLPALLPPATPARLGGIQTSFTPLNDRVHISNGVDLDVRWDGTAVMKLGIDAPTAVPLAGALVAGLLTGTVGFRATFVNGDEEESEGGPELRVTYAAGKSTIFVGASGDPQVTKIRLYRTTIGGQGIWLRVKEVATSPGIGVLFAADDACESDSLLGDQMEEFVNLPPPGPLKIVVQWPQAGRLLAVSVANPSVAYYSDIGLGFLKPGSWPPDNIILVSFDDGDEIVGIYPLFESVIIQKRRSTWRLRGIPPDFTLEPVHFDEDRTGIGGWNQRAGVMVDNDRFLPGQDGAYSMGRYQDSGFESSRISRVIDDLWAELAVQDVNRFHAVFHRRRHQVRLFVAIPPATDPDRCFVYQLDGNAAGEPNGWTWWDVPATASAVIQTTGGDRVYIGRDDGFLEEMDQGFEDHWTGTTPGNGQAYEFLYETHAFEPANEVGVDARARRLDVVARPSIAAQIVMSPLTDFSRNWPSFTLALVPSEAFILDTDPRSVPGAGILADVDAEGNPVGGTIMGEVTPVIYPCVFHALGRYHAVSFFNAEKGASFAIHAWMYRWQALPVKSRAPAVVQDLDSMGDTPPEMPAVGSGGSSEAGGPGWGSGPHGEGGW